MEYLQTTLRQIVCSTLIYAALGVFLLAQPDTSFMTLGKIIGVVFLIMGLLKSIFYFIGKQYEREQRNDLTIGIIIMIIGVFMLLKSEVSSEIVGYILGFVITISAILQFQYAVDLHHFEDSHVKICVIMGMLLFIFGMIALVNPFQKEKQLIVLMGTGMLVNAACSLVVGVFFGNCVQKEKKKAEITGEQQ